MSISLALLCAGNSTRFKHTIKKQWLRIKDKPLWLFVLDKFLKFYDFDKIILVGHKNEIKYMENFISNEKISIVAGGETRQESLKNAIENIESSHIMVSDVARSCMDKKFILDIINLKDDNDLIVPYINAVDTTLFQNDYLKREEMKLIQTPQLANTKLLKKYLDTKINYGDESSLFRANNAKIKYIKSKSKYLKLTTKEDLHKLDCLKKPSKQIFNGIGFDLHQLQKTGKVILGGITVSTKVGLKAHSDGDVLIHSIIDALLGASGGGDIGEFFPDTNDKYKGMSSVYLLQYIYNFINSVGYKIVNIDATIISQEIKISPFKKQIRHNLANVLNLPAHNINIKATTSEKIGSLGRNEGIAVLSTANLKFRNWKP